MATLPININSITTDNAKKIQADFALKKKGKAPNESTEHARPLPAPPKKAPAVRVTKDDIRAMEAAQDRVNPDAREKKAEEQLKHKVRMIRKIEDYKKAFPRKFAHLRVPSPSASIDTVRATLQEIRDANAAAGAEMQIRKGLPLVAMAMEKVVMDMGVNPMGWELTGFGMMMASADVQAAMEPETTEVVIENKELLSSPYYVRYFTKMVFMAGAYSEGRRLAGSSASSTVDPNLENKFADLAVADVAEPSAE